MSFCPSKDIHSIYLDREMPDVYRAEYEAHLKTCEACQKELAKLKTLHGIFEEDSKAISLNEKELDQSFEKLMIKMNYSKTTKAVSSASFGRKVASSIKYFVPAAAAAAIVALIVPLRVNSAKIDNAGMPAVASVASQIPSGTNVSFGSGKGVVISGNILESVLPSAAGMNNGFIQNVSTNSVPNTFIQDIDVFRPAFNDDKTISIKITVPGMNKIPVTAEINLPVPVTGHF